MPNKIKSKVSAATIIAVLITTAGLFILKIPFANAISCSYPFCATNLQITTFSTTSTTLSNSGSAAGEIQSSGGSDWCNDGTDFILVPGDDYADPVSPNATWKIFDSSNNLVSTGSFLLTQTQAGQNGHYCPPVTVVSAYLYSFGSFNVDISALPAGNYTYQAIDADGYYDIRTFTKGAGTGTVNVGTNNAGSTWSFPSSAGNPCGTCSGTGQTYTNQAPGTYNFSPASIYATTEVSTSGGNGGTTCSSGSVCNLAGGGLINFTATYTNTTCTVAVQGMLNGSNQSTTGQSFSITGPSNINATDTTGYQTYSLPADASGTNYNFVVNSPQNGLNIASSTDLTIGNRGFETPSLGSGAGAYQYNPPGASWSFAASTTGSDGNGNIIGGSGITGNNSGFTSSNPNAPEGAQVAFLQGGNLNFISQSISGFQTGVNYIVSFQAAQRGNFNTGGQDFDVYLDATFLGTFRPASTSYATMSTSAFTTTAGTHVLKFVGRDSAGGNANAVFIDAVHVTGSGTSYLSDYQGVNTSSQRCTPGQTVTFQIQYQTRPVLQVQ